jgi:chitodextrinase
MPFQRHRLRHRRTRLAFGPAAAALFAACTEPTTPTENPAEAEGPASLPAFEITPTSTVLVGAGDIAGCASTFGDEQTASLMLKELENPNAIVFAAGDEVYPNGTTSEFNLCYKPTWGQDSIMRRTKPVAGNHEYNTAGAGPYFDFFNGVGVDSGVAGKRGKGYYAYDAGPWRVVVLNSNSSQVSTAKGSPQETWLKGELSRNTGKCVMAMMHHPRFWSYSGTTAPAMPYLPFWQDFYNLGVDLVIVGHQHFYERFSPQTPMGLADNTFGVPQIIIGTGGVTTSSRSVRRPNSQAFGTSFGILRLGLDAGQYAWTFVPVAGASFTDAGAGVSCHGVPPANKAPVAGFITQGTSTNYTCANLTCNFVSNALAPAERSFDPDPPTDPPPPAGSNGLVAWKWTFGNGKTSTSQNKTFTYGAAGTYTVKLTVTDGRGLTAGKSHLVTVSAGSGNVAPSASFTESCTNLSCGFTDASTDSDGTVTAWSWNFGDGHTSTAQNPSNVYATGGTYTVSLKVTDNGGATNTTSHTVTVPPPSP